ncbi:VOC family protein [Mucilaginibacter dorajii]|uniref:Glyoxalase n=1 Tax=Mucilaginibacter dorajii TaxID=692994 RepID=A0ABP7QM65_9SPHI|nr:VOC family protein [Mucilaginibacter dorajii]MCS3735883.1 PhnB protein [Mucilaginibacter dorajii]
MITSTQQIIPMLSYEDGVAAMEWLCEVFGFTEITRMTTGQGRLAHGEIAMRDSLVMLAEPTPDYQSPKHHIENCAIAAKAYQVPYIINGVLVYVDDVKAHFVHAKATGATILSELEEGYPGSRYRAADLEGQRWMFMEKK